MKNVLVNNGMNNEEFKEFCLNYQSTKKQKELDFTDFISFILYTAIECEEDMGFLDAKSYHEGNFNNCKYATGEDVWEQLEKLIGIDYDTMEEEFKSIRWEDNENTAIINFKNDDKEYAILAL